jgi:hypothetical protein
MNGAPRRGAQVSAANVEPAPKNHRLVIEPVLHGKGELGRASQAMVGSAAPRACVLAQSACSPALRLEPLGYAFGAE